MRKMSRFVAIIMVFALLAGCASIVSKSSYPVLFTSQPDSADITISDETGRAIFNGKTPTTVTLEAGAGYFKGKDYSVTFSKEGYAKYTTTVRRDVDGWYIVGNIFIGGLIGWLIVDPATGAMWTLPREVAANLSPEISMMKSSEKVQIISLDEIPQHLRSEMVRVN